MHILDTKCGGALENLASRARFVKTIGKPKKTKKPKAHRARTGQTIGENTKTKNLNSGPETRQTHL